MYRGYGEEDMDHEHRSYGVVGREQDQVDMIDGNLPQ
jgi:hypothetical protein